MSSRFPEVRTLLQHFDTCQDTSDSICRKIVDKYLNKVLSEVNCNDDFVIQDSKFIHVGSSVEETVTSPTSDFDVALILPFSCTSEKLQAVTTDYPGLYKLRVGQNNMYLHDDFINYKNFLKVEELQDNIFEELEQIIDPMQSFADYNVTYKKMGCSFQVYLKRKNGAKIKIDIVPQIPASIGDIPDFDNGIVIPVEFEDEVFFSLSAPPDLEENYRHLVVQPSFAMIELKYLKSSEVVRESLRIAKAVTKHFDLYPKGLRSFHLKRVAIANFEEIQQSNDAWDGYKIILRDLKDMLKDDIIEGYFIEDQNLLCQDTSEELIQNITDIRRTIHPNNILRRLEIE